MLRSCFMSSFVEFRSAVSEEKSKMSQSIRGQGSHLVFPIGPKNTILVKDVEILFHVKFRWIPFSGFKGEVENLPSNQRQGRQSCFFFRSTRKKNKNLSEDFKILPPVMFRCIPFSSFREVENVSDTVAIIFFSDRPEKHKLGRRRSCFLSSFIAIEMSLRLRCAKRRRNMHFPQQCLCSRVIFLTDPF